MARRALDFLVLVAVTGGVAAAGEVLLV